MLWDPQVAAEAETLQVPELGQAARSQAVMALETTPQVSQGNWS